MIEMLGLLLVMKLFRESWSGRTSRAGSVGVVRTKEAWGCILYTNDRVRNEYTYVGQEY